MVHIVWYSENMEEQLSFIQRSKLSKKYPICVDADIYDKDEWNSDACNVKLWDLYNSMTDIYIKWYIGCCAISLNVL